MKKNKITDLIIFTFTFQKIRFLNKHYLILGISIIFFYLFFACNHNEKKDTISITKDIRVDTILPLEKVVSLKNNLEYIGLIRSISFVDTKNFVVSTTEPAMVMLYNINGNQIRRIGDKGRGPFEYSSPSIVKTYNEMIYVWCNMNTKIFVYDISGEPLIEYDFDKAIYDFEVNDDYIFFYTTGGFKDRPIIEIYNINSEKFIEQEYGKQTNEQLLLDLHSSAGAITLSDSKLFFSLNHKPLIYKVNLNNWSKNTYQINDPSFNVIDIDMTPEEILQDMIGNAEYIMGSDIITGMFWIEDNFIMIGEVGEIKLNGLDYQDLSERKQRYYVFDQNMNLEYAISAKINKHCNTAFFTTDGNHLYGLNQRDFGEKFEYELVKIGYNRKDLLKQDRKKSTK